MSAEDCHLPNGSARMKSPTAVVTDLQPTLKGLRGGDASGMRGSVVTDLQPTLKHFEVEMHQE